MTKDTDRDVVTGPERLSGPERHTVAIGFIALAGILLAWVTGTNFVDSVITSYSIHYTKLYEDNAVKFTPRGSVEIIARTQSREGGDLRLLFAVADIV